MQTGTESFLPLLFYFAITRKMRLKSIKSSNSDSIKHYDFMFTSILVAVLVEVNNGAVYLSSDWLLKLDPNSLGTFTLTFSTLLSYFLAVPLVCREIIGRVEHQWPSLRREDLIVCDPPLRVIDPVNPYLRLDHNTSMLLHEPSCI